MIMRLLFAIFLIVCFGSSYASGYYHDSIELDTNKIDFGKLEQYTSEFSAVQLYNVKVLENRYEDGALSVYNTVHKKTYVCSDRGVEYFNRVYIPTGRAEEIIGIKARTITKSGKIINLNENNIKEVENLDGKGAFKAFAIEGVENGSVVEVLYTIKEMVATVGAFLVQTQFPSLYTEFVLITPSYLQFDTKGYYADFTVTDTIITDQKIITYTLDSIPALHEEKYSTRDANLARIDYHFKMNTNYSSIAINTWNKITTNLYESYYVVNKAADKKIAKLLKTLKIADASEHEKIKAIENYIKDNFQFSNESIPEFENIEFIVKNRIANERGYVILLLRAFSLANITHQLCFTSNRFEIKFDESFPSYRFLNENLIYFPSIDKYMSPDKFSRLGIIDEGCLNNKGLFLIETVLGQFKSAVHEIREILPNAMEENFTKQIITAEIKDGTAFVDYRYVLGGYEAAFIKPYYDYMPDDKKESYLEQLLKIMGEDTKVIDKKVLNFDHNITDPDKPFTIQSKLEIKSLIEKAGENIIFNVGNVIGEQVEMYDDHERENPIEIKHKHYYKREIAVKIPAGYEAKGLESLNITKEYGNGERNTMGFVSSYKTENDQIVIDVYEYYDSMEYPIEQYEEFRDVINAAADFNKVSVVFEKK